MTAFYGEVLDSPQSVNQQVDGFTFPTKREIEENLDVLYFDPDQEFLFFDDIKSGIDSALPGIYKDVVDIQQDQQAQLEAIAKAHGIPLEATADARIGVNDNERTITEKIYTAHARRLAKKGFEVKRLYESLEALNPTEADYQEKLAEKTAELSGVIDQQNKEELSRYIIRREMVAEMVRKILAQKLSYQAEPTPAGSKKDKEALIHDLIFKRKSPHTTAALNDLWILDEEFIHFDGCSDVPINQIVDCDGNSLLSEVSEDEIKALGLKLDRRPDVFLFAAEGKCVIVEFKSADTDLSDHLNQMPKYCALIANYSRAKITKFYCYLIGENLNPLTDLNDYEETVNGDWFRTAIPIRSVNANNRERIALAQIEILKLSSIHARATRRNHSFAEKLGLPELLSAALHSLEGTPPPPSNQPS